MITIYRSTATHEGGGDNYHIIPMKERGRGVDKLIYMNVYIKID